jgi:Tol biopolymer transport system component
LRAGRRRSTRTRIAFLRRETGTSVGLFVASAKSGTPRRLAGVDASATGLEWSPDGRRLAYEVSTPRDAIFLVGVRNGRIVKRADGDLAAWSPDGRRLAFRRGVSVGAHDLFVVNTDGPGLRRLTRGVTVYSRPSWSPDGRHLAFYPCCNEGFAVLDLASGRMRAVADGVRIPSWSPDGRWIALGGAGTALIRPNGGGLRLLSREGSSVEPPAWSPDGRALAVVQPFLTPEGYLEAEDVWVIPVNGRRSTRLTQGWRFGYWNRTPRWHPIGASAETLRGRSVSWASPTDSVTNGNLLRLTRPVLRLAADEARVAVASGSEEAPVGALELWTPGKEVVRVGPTVSRTEGLGLAGARVAWSSYTTAQSRDIWRVESATVGIPRGTFVHPPHCCGEPRTDLVGNGSLLVFTQWGPCRLSRAEACAREPKGNARLFRLDGEKAVQIASSSGALTPRSVDAGRILVDHEDGTLEVMTAQGASLRSLRLNADVVRGVRLQGNDLVVVTTSSVEVTDVESGAFLRRWPLPSESARLEDLQDGIAVLVAGTSVHLLRLSDGRAATSPSPALSRYSHSSSRAGSPLPTKWPTTTRIRVACNSCR